MSQLKKQKPKRKENKVICNEMKTCTNSIGCPHATPHTESLNSCSEEKCQTSGLWCECIPYEEDNVFEIRTKILKEIWEKEEN
jgi:hypothetical protein